MYNIILKTCKTLFILFLLFTYASEVFASGPDIEGTYGDTVAPILKYEIRMKKVEFYYTTGDHAGQWYTVFENQDGAPADIAQADAGQKAGDFFAGVYLPVGHISQVRKTISGTFVLKAKVNQNGITYYSKSDGTASINPDDYATCSTSSTDTSNTEDMSLDIAEGTSLTFKVKFNLLSANTGGTTGCVGLREVGSYIIAPRRPNTTKEITYN